MIRLEATDDQQTLNFEFLQTFSNLVKFAFGQGALGAKVSSTLTNPAGHIGPVIDKNETELNIIPPPDDHKPFDDPPIHLLNIASDETLNAIMNTQNGVTAIDAIAHERTYSGVHAACWRTDRHNILFVLVFCLSCE